MTKTLADPAIFDCYRAAVAVALAVALGLMVFSCSGGGDGPTREETRKDLEKDVEIYLDELGRRS